MSNMSCPFPVGINGLSSTGFMFSITKLPELTYFCQAAAVPAISLDAAEQGSPFVRIPVPGEILTYGELNIQFMIDEKMLNYKAVYNWMVGLAFPTDNDEYKQFISKQSTGSELIKSYSDGSLVILGSNFHPVQTFTFIDMFPTSLETLMFQSNSPDIQYLIGSANFRYTYMKM